ncbi:hypothetical protein [Kaarinaea lacus]
MEEETRELLLRTAFLDEVTDDAARTLTGNYAATRILSELARSHFFTQRLAGSGNSYRCHPFYRRFLQLQAHTTYDSQQLVEIQRISASLMASAGQIENAVMLLHNSADWQGLIELILQHAPGLVAESQHQRLERCLGFVPPQLRTTHPRLLYWLGVCRLMTVSAEAQDYFEQAFLLFDSSHSELTHRLLCVLGIVDAILLRGSDFTALDPWITWLDQHISVDDKTLSGTEIEARAAITMFRALLYRAPQHAHREQWAERAFMASEVTAEIHLRLQACTSLALYFRFCGNFSRERILTERIQALVHLHPDLAVVQLHGKWNEAINKWMAQEDDTAMLSIEDGLQLAASSGLPVWDHLLLTEGVYAALNHGDRVLAAHYLERQTAILETDNTHQLGEHEYLQAWYQLVYGEIQHALSHARAAVALAVQNGCPYAEAIYRLALVQVLVTDGELAEAAKELRLAAELVAGFGQAFFTYIYEITHADVAFHLQNNRQALDALKAAMALGRRYGFINLFTWNPELMTRLCTRAFKHHIETDYVEHLIRRRKLSSVAPPIELENWPWPVRIYTLGRFSMEKDGQPVQFSRKNPTKQLELLKAIIAFGGQRVKETQLSDALWPDAEGDMAYQNFTATLHRLRKLIGHDVIELSNRCVTLNRKYCWVDCFALEHMLDRIRNAKQKSDEYSLIHRAVRLYQGPFLAEEDAFWVLAPRQRLEKKFRLKLGGFDQRIGVSIKPEAAFSKDGLDE